MPTPCSSRPSQNDGGSWNRSLRTRDIVAELLACQNHPHAGPRIEFFATDRGELLWSDGPVTQASPTLYDQQLYRTARVGKEFRYRLAVPPGLYTVHLKFAELWLKEPGQRPMDITINDRLVWKAWDPAAAAGQMRMAADVRTGDVTPDENGHITIHLQAAGPNPAILQGLEVE